MIKSYEHAIRTQTRRLMNGKIGLSKAISRYLLKHHSEDYRTMKNKIMREAFDQIEPETESDEVAA